MYEKDFCDKCGMTKLITDEYLFLYNVCFWVTQHLIQLKLHLRAFFLVKILQICFQRQRWLIPILFYVWHLIVSHTNAQMKDVAKNILILYSFYLRLPFTCLTHWSENLLSDTDSNFTWDFGICLPSSSFSIRKIQCEFFDPNCVIQWNR